MMKSGRVLGLIFLQMLYCAALSDDAVTQCRIFAKSDERYQLEMYAITKNDERQSMKWSYERNASDWQEANIIIHSKNNTVEMEENGERREIFKNISVDHITLKIKPKDKDQIWINSTCFHEVNSSSLFRIICTPPCHKYDENNNKNSSSGFSNISCSPACDTPAPDNHPSHKKKSASDHIQETHVSLYSNGDFDLELVTTSKIDTEREIPPYIHHGLASGWREFTFVINRTNGTVDMQTIGKVERIFENVNVDNITLTIIHNHPIWIDPPGFHEDNDTFPSPIKIICPPPCHNYHKHDNRNSSSGKYWPNVWLMVPMLYLLAVLA